MPTSAHLSHEANYDDIISGSSFLGYEVFSSEQDSKNLRAARSKFFLKFAYSNEEARFFPHHYQMLRKANEDLLSTSADPNVKKFSDVALKVLNAIDQNKKIQLADGRTIEVIDVPYERHAAYMVIERDKFGVGKKLTYCDGTSLEAGFGAVSFDLKDSPDLTKKIIQKLVNNQGEIRKGASFNREKLYDSIKDFVECGIDGMPEIEATVPAKMQRRSNCGYKSFKILTAVVAGIIDPELSCATRESSGFKAYADYKHEAISCNVKNLLSIRGDQGCQLVERDIEEVVKNARRKNDHELLEMIDLYKKEDDVRGVSADEEREEFFDDGLSDEDSIEAFEDVPSQTARPNIGQQEDAPSSIFKPLLVRKLDDLAQEALASCEGR